MQKRRGITLDDLPPHYREMAEKQLLEANQSPAQASREAALAVLTTSGGSDSGQGRRRGKKRREMNATEAEFMAFIRREWASAKSVEYESITLRWGEGSGLLTYTPDFVAKFHHSSGGKHPHILHIFFEVKGAWAWQKDIVKFKAARAQFTEYEFQLWEKDEQGRWHHTI